jgi:hypothetical protein
MVRYSRQFTRSLSCRAPMLTEIDPHSCGYGRSCFIHLFLLFRDTVQLLLNMTDALLCDDLYKSLI